MKIPCENCITFPICKNEAIDLSKGHIHLNHLAIKCIMFKHYCLKRGCLTMMYSYNFHLNNNHLSYADILLYFARGKEKQLKRVVSENVRINLEYINE